MLKSKLKRVAQILSILILLAQCFNVAARAQAVAAPPQANTSAAPSAASLIQAATVSIARDLDGAKAQLDQAQALSPDHKLYWATTGNLLLKRNQNAEALAAFRKELVLFPGETAMYRSIVDTQFALKQRKDAMATLHDWSVADSTDPLPARKLISLLVEDGDATAGLRKAKMLCSGFPKRVAKMTTYRYSSAGRNYLGDKAGGIKRIHALLASTDNGAIADNAAYVLADSGADLATAKRSHGRTLTY